MYVISGIRKRSGTKKSTGEVYSGYEVHFNWKDPAIEGMGAGNEYIPEDKLNGQQLALGKKIFFNRNRQGYLESVVIM